jgi:hypothetical protein
MAIRIVDVTNPYFLVVEKNNKTEVAISIIGSSHESVIALAATKGDFNNTI